MASEYLFRRIIGVELLAELNEVAQQNIARYHSERQKCCAIESHTGDARSFEFPREAVVLYLFNPFSRICAARGAGQPAWFCDGFSARGICHLSQT